MARQQEALVGAPSVYASTDIYDGIVEREVIRREEAVYLLKNVVSRKPPQIAPNWKTSICFFLFYFAIEKTRMGFEKFCWCREELKDL